MNSLIRTGLAASLACAVLVPTRLTVGCLVVLALVALLGRFIPIEEEDL